MSDNNDNITDISDISDNNPQDFVLGKLEQDFERRKTKRAIRKIIYNTIKNLIVIAAVIVLITNLLISVMIVSRGSMNPTLQDGDIVVAVRWVDGNPGDVIAFYYNNIIQIKRVIAKEGDWIDIKEDGTVYVNKDILDEPYLTEKYLGECDIEFPYQVPVGSVFVMGDQRKNSIDSRLNEIGPIKKENIIGKVFIRIWPLSKIRII